MSACLPDWETVIAELEQLSLQLLERARQEDWETVMADQPRRLALFEICFACPVPPQAAATVIAGLRRVMDLNDQLMELARQHQDELGQRLGGMNRGRQARAAYGVR